MLDIRVFTPLTEYTTLEGNQIGKIQAARVRFTEDLYNPGDWSMELSGYQDGADFLRQGHLILFRSGNISLWGIVRGISDDNSGMGISVLRTGDDLKGYLKQRICLYPKGGDVEGFDTVKGSTETVMKHYVENNLVSPANLLRTIPKFTVAQDRGRGAAEDKYMARFNKLTDLLSEVGQAQKLGYTVGMDIASGSMVFDVIEGTDRTAGQSATPRILFDVNLRTAASSRYVSDLESYRNAFYTTKSGARTEAEATTLLYFREGEEEPAGINRYETQISVSVDDTAADIAGEMQNLARKEMTNFEKDDTFTIELNGGFVYGRDFFLGDFVTVQDRFMGIQEDVQLISVTHEWSGIGYRITGTFGKPRKTNLELLERQIKTEGGR